MTRYNKLTALFILSFVSFILVACGGGNTETDNGGDPDVVETDTSNPDVTPEQVEGDGDSTDPDVVPDEVGTDDGTDPDQVPDEVEPDTSVCPTGQALLELDGASECVDKVFADTVNAINGRQFVAVVPDDGTVADCEVHFTANGHPVAQELCAGVKYYINTFSPVSVLCLEDDLSFSLCKNTNNVCNDGRQIRNGKLEVEDSKFYVNFDSPNDVGTWITYSYEMVE